MDLNLVQSSIVQHLAADFATIDADFLAKDLPDAEADYDAGLRKPIAYVVCVGSTGTPTVATYPIAQPRKLKINVEIHSRKIYGPTGLNIVGDIVEQSLIGFRPANCKELSLLADDLTKTAEGIWVKVYQLQCDTMLVQKEKNEPIIIQQFKDVQTLP